LARKHGSVESLAKKIYYGWWVLLAAFWTLFVCAGIGFSTLAVFLKFVAADMQWGRDTISNAGAISALAAGFAAPLVGHIIDKYGVRAAMIPGAVILSCGFLLLSRVSVPYQFYLLYLVVGVGMSATTILPAQTLASRWFEKKRGRAMGIITVAAGLGSVVWIPISTRLVGAMGWRGAYGVLGTIIAVASLPLIVLVIRSSPASMGLAVDGESGGSSRPDNSATEPPPAPEEKGYTMREAFGTPSMWLIFCATFFVMVPSSGFGLHVISFLTDSGLSPERAALAWSSTLGISICGRFFFGWISERFQKRHFAAAANVVRAASLFLLVLFSFEMLPAALAIAQLAVLYGLGNGCNAVINPLIVSETFGTKSFGKLMGTLGIPFTIGMALGMFVAGRLFVSAENYNIAFIVFALAFICAGTAIFFAKPLFLLDSRSAAAEGES